MRVSATHTRVENLKTAKATALKALYWQDERGQVKEIHGPELHGQKVKEIEGKFDSDLLAIMAEGQAAADEAAKTLAKVDNPYSWLIGDDAAKASTLAAFFREDFADMDAAGVAQAMESSGDSNVERWLIHRYGLRRLNELDTDVKTAAGPTERARIAKASAALRERLMLPSQLKELKAAEAKAQEARLLHDAAEWARPSIRREFAARMGVQEEYLPD